MNKINDFRVEWKLIPSRAPHFGGAWERMIGLTKFCLKKVLGTSLISFTEMQTLLCEIECNLNNRPITYVSDDIGEEPVTPSHLIYGRKLHYLGNVGIDLSEISDYSFNEENVHKCDLKVRLLLDHFWRKWKEEYLKALRERDNSLIGKNVKISLGDVVIICEDTPRSMWQIGKVVELLNSKDSIVRAVKLKTKNGVVSRPVIKLLLLEIPTDKLKQIKSIDVPNNLIRDVPVRQSAAVARNKIKNMI